MNNILEKPTKRKAKTKSYSQPTSEEAKFFIRNLDNYLAECNRLGCKITTKEISNLGDHMKTKPVLSSHLKRLKGISHLYMLLVFTEFPLTALSRLLYPHEIAEHARKRLRLRDEGYSVESRFIEKLNSLRDA